MRAAAWGTHCLVGQTLSRDASYTSTRTAVLRGLHDMPEHMLGHSWGVQGELFGCALQRLTLKLSWQTTQVFENGPMPAEALTSNEPAGREIVSMKR